MGNVNGREDGNGSPTGSGFGSASGLVVEEEEDEIGGPKAVDAAATLPTALIGRSPPHSPGPAKSPLKFGPQVLLPLLLSFIFLVS